MNAIAPQRDPNEDWEGIGELWDRFLENYNAFKNGEMRPEDEDKYRLLSSPGPSQYCAFVNLFDFFKKEAMMAKENSSILYTYDLVDTEELTARPMLEFLENLCSSAYDAKGKNIIIASGSFWEQNLVTRAKAICYFEELYNKGAVVKIYAQAKEDEESIANIIEPIKKESHFSLKNRIPIHFIKADKDYIQPEFPHTESSLFRLTMFLDLHNIEPELKEGKTKEELSIFFDEMIRRAL
jgi:hypothetical protein